MKVAGTKQISRLRKDAVQIFQSGIDAADPYRAVKRCLQFDGQQLICRLDLNDARLVRKKKWQKIHLIAFGKAACAMIKAAQEIIPVQFLAKNAIALTNYENVQEIARVKVIGAGHPLPDQAGLTGTQKIIEQVSQAQAGELVLVLVSGGGSALMPAPVANTDLADKTATTELLLGSGASINEINCVRKHLSLVKGGGLAKIAFPADLHAMILSDVLGDDLSSIASGPTVADNSSFSDAVSLLEEKMLWDKVPAAVRDHLYKGSQGQLSETPESDDPLFKQVTQVLIGSNTISLQAITQAAGRLNYAVFLYDEQLTGEAKHVAEKLADFVKDRVDKGINKPCAILAGGETTVTLKGTGLGGRNQELALRLALLAEKQGWQGDWVFLSGGTDGRDGPCDAAGGLVDNTTLARMRKAGISPEELLANNDSYHALQSSNDLLMTGATGTNVADLQVLIRA